MKTLSPDRRFLYRWLLANAVGLLLAAMVGAAVVGAAVMGSAMALSTAIVDNKFMQASTYAGGGIFVGLLFTILIGAPALPMILAGGALFGDIVGPPLMGFITLASAGAVIGLMQWTIIRNRLPRARFWIVASACGWGLAGIAFGMVTSFTLVPLSNPTVGALIAGHAISSGYAVSDYLVRYALTGFVLGAIGGGASGALQLLALRGSYRSIGWWIVGNTFGWAVRGAICALIATGLGLVLGGLTAGVFTAFALRQMSELPAP